MRRRTVALVAMLCVLLAVAAVADEGNTIPVEFGGVRMGALRSDLDGLRFSRSVRVEDSMTGSYEVRFYEGSFSPSELGGAALKRVEYGFCDDYVCAIRAEARGSEAYEALVGEFVRRYGTEDRRVFLYGANWNRYFERKRDALGRSVRWVLCEHETDNCAVFSIRWRSKDDGVVLLLGDQFVEP